MAIAAKVWGPGESEPPDGVLTNLRSAPPNWFREDPAYAAELYALERNMVDPPVYTVYVRDVKGVLHQFSVRVSTELVVRVCPL